MLFSVYYLMRFCGCCGTRVNVSLWLLDATSGITRATVVLGYFPGGELRDGDAGKDADEQLAGQSFLIPFLLRMGYAPCRLWLIF